MMGMTKREGRYKLRVPKLSPLDLETMHKVTSPLPIPPHRSPLEPVVVLEMLHPSLTPPAPVSKKNGRRRPRGGDRHACGRRRRHRTTSRDSVSSVSTCFSPSHLLLTTSQTERMLGLADSRPATSPQPTKSKLSSRKRIYFEREGRCMPRDDSVVKAALELDKPPKPPRRPAGAVKRGRTTRKDQHVRAGMMDRAPENFIAKGTTTAHPPPVISLSWSLARCPVLLSDPGCHTVLSLERAPVPPFADVKGAATASSAPTKDSGLSSLPIGLARGPEFKPLSRLFGGAGAIPLTLLPRTTGLSSLLRTLGHLGTNHDRPAPDTRHLPGAGALVKTPSPPPDPLLLISVNMDRCDETHSAVGKNKSRGSLRLKRSQLVGDPLLGDRSPVPAPRKPKTPLPPKSKCPQYSVRNIDFLPDPKRLRHPLIPPTLEALVRAVPPPPKSKGTGRVPIIAPRGVIKGRRRGRKKCMEDKAARAFSETLPTVKAEAAGSSPQPITMEMEEDYLLGPEPGSNGNGEDDNYHHQVSRLSVAVEGRVKRAIERNLICCRSSGQWTMASLDQVAGTASRPRKKAVVFSTETTMNPDIGRPNAMAKKKRRQRIINNVVDLLDITDDEDDSNAGASPNSDDEDDYTPVPSPVPSPPPPPIPPLHLYAPERAGEN